MNNGQNREPQVKYMDKSTSLIGSLSTVEKILGFIVILLLIFVTLVVGYVTFVTGRNV